MDSTSMEKEIDKLKSENTDLATKVNILENKCDCIKYDMDSLQNDTKRCLNIISDFQEQILQYTHYLEDKINEISNIRPILIMGNKEESKHE